MKKLFFVLAGVCSIITVKGQGPKELNIGEQVPDMVMNNIENYSSKNVRLSEFQGKLLILDFWATTCTSCVGSWPKLQQLQNEFKDKIQIVLINSNTREDTKQKLESFFKSRKERKLFVPNLPFLNQDSIFKKVFPYYTIPTIIWINNEGKMIARTEHYYLTSDNVKKALTGNINLPVKLSRGRNYDPTTPFLQNGNGGADSLFAQRSIFSKYIDGLPGGGGKTVSENGKVISVIITNGCRRNFYEEYFANTVVKSRSDISGLRNEFLDLRIKDKKNFSVPKQVEDYKEFIPNQQYCYQVFIKEDSKRDIYEIMKSDIDGFFNYESYVETRSVKCFKLVKLPGKDKILTKGGTSYNNLSEPGITKLIVTNVRWFDFFAYLDNLLLMVDGLPIILNEIEYPENVDITIEVPKDILHLKSELNKYNLDLVEITKSFPVLVIKDRE